MLLELYPGGGARVKDYSEAGATGRKGVNRCDAVVFLLFVGVRLASNPAGVPETETPSCEGVGFVAVPAGFETAFTPGENNIASRDKSLKLYGLTQINA